MGQDNSRNDQLTNVGRTAGNAYTGLMSDQTPLEKEFIPQSQQMWNNYMNAHATNVADYGDIMGGYQSFAQGLGKPTKFGFQTVNAQRPGELGESYGYLREAMPGYRDFAQTGGYSPTDIQELRARGISPIRSAYGNTMMELNRARALGSAGWTPNYIAAASKAQRELPGQMADAMTTVNASLADAIRQGKLAGLSGMTGIGSTMGGLSSQEAGRMLQADMANQNADLQAQQLSEQSLQNLRGSQLAALSGRTSLYGTVPGMTSTFGNQALQAYAHRLNLEQMRNQYGLGLLDAQIRSYGGQSQQQPWWQQALGAAGSILPYLKNPFKGGDGGDTPTNSPSTPAPSGGGGPSLGSPTTPYNWYNNAPQMPTNNWSPSGSTSSNWYPAPGQGFPSTPQSGGSNGSYDPNLDSSNWFTPNNSNPWNNFGGWQSPLPSSGFGGYMGLPGSGYGYPDSSSLLNSTFWNWYYNQAH